jgi:monofunctional biosynthetic peptidoglycan transglycosylase
MYLNVAQTGPGVFGVEAAAKYYFKKKAKDLSRKEAAMIASCLPNPVLFTIHPLSRRVAYRYPWIMRQMNNLQADEDIRALLK